MDGLFVLLGIAASAYLLIGPLFGFLAFRRARAQRDDIALLKRHVSLLGQRIDQLRDAMVPRGEGLDQAETPRAATEPVVEPETPAVEPAAPEPSMAEAPVETPPELETPDRAAACVTVYEATKSVHVPAQPASFTQAIALSLEQTMVQPVADHPAAAGSIAGEQVYGPVPSMALSQSSSVSMTLPNTRLATRRHRRA